MVIKSILLYLHCPLSDLWTFINLYVICMSFTIISTKSIVSDKLQY